MKSYHNLTEDQKKAITRLYEYDETYLYAKPGSGKSVVALTAVKELIGAGVLHKVLVIAPLRVCQLTWATEHKEWKHLQDMNTKLCTGSAASRVKILESMKNSNGLLVVNFENVAWLLRETKFASMFDGLVIDELTKLKSGGGTTFKAMRGKLKHIQWRVGLTGTPVSENFEGLYGQTMMIDKGLRLGTRKDTFMSNYFYPTDYNRYNWELKPGGGEKIVKAIGDLLYTLPDYRSDLPPVTVFKLLLDMPDDVREVYADMAHRMLVELEDGEVEAPNSAAKQGKLQQIANGFLYLQNEIDDVRSVSVIHDVKFKAVQRLMDDIGDSLGGVMLVYNHTYELDRLLELYPDAGVLGAGVTAKKAASYVEAWNARELEVLIVHPKSAGHGVNLALGGCHMIWLAPCWSRDLWEQTIARLWRRGQKHPVNVSVLLMRDSVDEIIMSRVEGKAEHEDDFIRHLKKLGSA